MLTETFQNFFLRLKDVFANYNFLTDTIDIFLVALVVYALIAQLRKTQAIQVMKGLLLVLIAYGIVYLLGMNTTSFIFGKLFSDILIIFVILFSNELRQALGHIGKKRFGSKFSIFGNSKEDDNVDAINAVCRACNAMSRNNVGSLILFQRNILLGDLTKQAVSIDSETTYEMLCSIFYPKAPLHDGAVIISDGRIVAARCIVPMKNEKELNENLGTRHRAAVDASLNSDCVAVVTSEETGCISLAVEGELKYNIKDSELRSELGKLLLSEADNGEKKSVGFIKKIRAKKSSKEKKSDKKTVVLEDEKGDSENE